MNCLPRTDFIQNYITANLFGVRENAHQIFALGRRSNMEYGLGLSRRRRQRSISDWCMEST